MKDFRPLNPWGRDMPRNQRQKQELYQLVVEENGKMKVVGPAIAKMFADDFAATVRKNILSGKEKIWSNPTVVKVSTGVM